MVQGTRGCGAELGSGRQLFRISPICTRSRHSSMAAFGLPSKMISMASEVEMSHQTPYDLPDGRS